MNTEHEKQIEALNALYRYSNILARVAYAIPEETTAGYAEYQIVIEQLQDLYAENKRLHEALKSAIKRLETVKECNPEPEDMAQSFHEIYEHLSPSFGYETRQESAKPWAEVPENNRQLMIAVCAEIKRRYLKLTEGKNGNI